MRIFPTVHSSEMPNCLFHQNQYTRCAHLTGAQLLICPKCPSTAPLEVATANIITQSGLRMGLRICFTRVDAWLKSSTMMHILHYRYKKKNKTIYKKCIRNKRTSVLSNFKKLALKLTLTPSILKFLTLTALSFWAIYADAVNFFR